MKLSIEHIDPSNGDFAFKKMALLETAEKLDPRLIALLWEELSNGNFLSEAGYGFPDKDSLYVSLSRPFQKAHKAPEGVSYSENSDPHYNLACYVAEGPVPQALCAPFPK